MPADRVRQVGLFVVVVAVVVGGAAAVPALQGGGDGPPTPPEVTNEQFQPGDFPAGADDGGEIRMDSEASGKTILVDTGHENDLSAAKTATLTRTLVENGHEVQFLGQRAVSMNESLRRADALVVVNPMQRYSREEIQGVRAFADAGGRVVVLSDPPSTQISGGLFVVSTQTVGSKTAALGSPLGVAFGSDYLYDLSENANNFRDVYGTPADGSGPIAAGVDRVVLRGAAPVTTADGTTALGSEATLESTRREGTYAVAVRNGNVTAVGDSDFLAPANAYDADNEVLIGNLADYLVSGEKTPPNAPVPPAPTGPGAGPGPGPGPMPPGPGPGPGPGPSEPTPTPAATDAAV